MGHGDIEHINGTNADDERERHGQAHHCLSNDQLSYDRLHQVLTKCSYYHPVTHEHDTCRDHTGHNEINHRSVYKC